MAWLGTWDGPVWRNSWTGQTGGGSTEPTYLNAALQVAGLALVGLDARQTIRAAFSVQGIGDGSQLAARSRLSAAFSPQGIGDVQQLSARIRLNSALSVQGVGYRQQLASRMYLKPALSVQGSGIGNLLVYTHRAATLQVIGAGIANLTVQRALQTALLAEGSSVTSLRATAWWRTVVRLHSVITPVVTLQSPVED